ncbi:MAG: hypothetical protein JXR78_01785 [Victivallales bacterium]|nr:hypothetical protein [Victivallales bacterium]
MIKEIEELIKEKKQINLVLTLKGKQILAVAGAKSEKGKIDPPVSVTANAEEIDAALIAAMLERWIKVEKEPENGKKPGESENIKPESEKQEEPKSAEDVFDGWL